MKNKDIQFLLNYIAGITEEMLYEEDELDDYTNHFFGEDVTYEFDEGASKKVIIFNSLGFVLKFDDYGDSKREVDIYNAAIDFGLADCFPETKMLCEHLNCQWIYQEIAKCYFDFNGRQLQQKAKKVKNNSHGIEMIYNMISDIPNCSRTDCMSEIWLRLAVEYFGLTFMGKLARFIQTYRINDLHRGNIGFIDNRPVLIDFCGYHWDEDYYPPD